MELQFVMAHVLLHTTFYTSQQQWKLTDSSYKSELSSSNSQLKTCARNVLTFQAIPIGQDSNDIEWKGH